MNIKNMLKINLKQIETETIVFDPDVRSYCKIAYEGHPNGCPRYNKNELCPPKSSFQKYKVINFKHHWLLYAIFDYQLYKIRMREENPDWTKKQIECVLYYQSQIMAKLRNELIRLIKQTNHPPFILSSGAGMTIDGEELQSMESAGIDVEQTFFRNDIDIDFPPINKIIKCCLISSNYEIKDKEDPQTRLTMYIRSNKKE